VRGKDRDAPPACEVPPHHLPRDLKRFLKEKVRERKIGPFEPTRQRFEAYLDKVVGAFADLVRAMPEGTAGFLSTRGNKCLTRSSWGRRCRFSSCCRSRRGSPGEAKRPRTDQRLNLGYSLEGQSPATVSRSVVKSAGRLNRTGVLARWSRGWWWGAVDGIEICSSLPAVRLYGRGSAEQGVTADANRIPY